jgi:hypothetical protein
MCSSVGTAIIDAIARFPVAQGIIRKAWTEPRSYCKEEEERYAPHEATV